MDDQANINGHTVRAASKPPYDVIFCFQGISAPLYVKNRVNKLKPALGSMLNH